MKRYTDSHEWAEPHEGHFRVGISRYAQEELGEIVHIELPEVGTEVKAGEEAAVLESTKAASDVYSPLSGTVIAINAKVRDNPALLNTSPEEEGWLFEVASSLEKQVEALMKESAYVKMVKG